MQIELCCIADIENDPTYGALNDAYQAHAIKDVSTFKARHTLEDYKMLEKTGVLTTMRAIDDDRLIGIMTLLDSQILHYGMGMMLSESFFVLPEYRKTGAGTRMKRLAEKCARNSGKELIAFSAPPDSQFAHVLEADDYTAQAVMYIKRLK